jgi:hypothetical protein
LLPDDVNEILDMLTDTQCMALLPLLQVRLRKFDSSQNDMLRRKLVSNIIRDLDDDSKCTPGLYQAALRLLGEDVSMIDQAMVPGSRVAEIAAQLPFKK